MKSFKIAIFSAFLLGGALTGYAERLELTTYYPAPYGVYNDLDLRSNSAQSARIRYFDTSSNSLYSLVLEGNPPTLVLRNARSGVGDRWYMAFREDNGVQVRGGADNSGSPGIFVRGSDGNVGIGTANPGTDKLRVQGPTRIAGNAQIDGNARVVGQAHVDGFRLGTSATADQVLTTDASGVGTWRPGGGGISGAGGGTCATDNTEVPGTYISSDAKRCFLTRSRSRSWKFGYCTTFPDTNGWKLGCWWAECDAKCIKW